MNRKRKLRNMTMALVPWTGIAISAYAATEGCWTNGTPPCVIAGTPCGTGGTASSAGTSQQAVTAPSGPGNVSLKIGTTFGCRFFCNPGGFQTVTQTQSIPTGSGC